MSESKRVKLTHGTATVDKNCSKETLTALDELSKLAYERESEPLNIVDVSKRFSITEVESLLDWILKDSKYTKEGFNTHKGWNTYGSHKQTPSKQIIEDFFKEK